MPEVSNTTSDDVQEQILQNRLVIPSQGERDWHCYQWRADGQGTVYSTRDYWRGAQGSLQIDQQWQAGG